MSEHDDEPTPSGPALLRWSMERSIDGHKVTDDDRAAFRAGYDAANLTSDVEVLYRAAALLMRNKARLAEGASKLHGHWAERELHDAIDWAVLTCSTLAVFS